jgi:hypothetical protein
MLFNIDIDQGRSIGGWLAPDNPNASPRIVVRIPGRDDLVITAAIHRPDIRDLGMHGTGLVGFEVSDRDIADLADIETIELLEAESGIPIYGRFLNGRHIEHKLFYFDCSVRPQKRIINAAAEHFTLNYSASERHSFETMIGVINNSRNKSIFITGRSNFNRYTALLHGAGFLAVAMLNDPFEELAERLLLLNLIAKSEAGHLLPTFFTGLEPLVDFARDLPFNNPKGLLAAFRGTTDDQRLALMSPMTKTFGCNIDEPPERRHVSIALENLASMDLVGVRGKFPAFRSLLAGLLGVDLFEENETVAYPSIRVLADSLSRIGLVTDLLEDDLALYSFTEESINIALPDQGGGAVQDAQPI